MMALEDRSYDRSGSDRESLSYHDEEQNDMNREDSVDGFDGRMVGHSSIEVNRENYDSMDYASKLQMKNGNEKHNFVGGGGGGATFIFKVRNLKCNIKLGFYLIL